VHLATKSFRGRQLLIRVTFLQDQLSANGRSGQPGVQPLRSERGVRLTLAIHDRFDVR
jgi:hypothetical protein